MSFSLGGPRGGQSHALSLSLCCVKVGTWHQIKAGRSGRDGYLELDGQQTIGNAPPGKGPSINYVVSVGEGGSPKDDLLNTVKLRGVDCLG